MEAFSGELPDTGADPSAEICPSGYCCPCWVRAHGIAEAGATSVQAVADLAEAEAASAASVAEASAAEVPGEAGRLGYWVLVTGTLGADIL